MCVSVYQDWAGVPALSRCYAFTFLICKTRGGSDQMDSKGPSSSDVFFPVAYSLYGELNKIC